MEPGDLRRPFAAHEPEIVPGESEALEPVAAGSLGVSRDGNIKHFADDKDPTCLDLSNGFTVAGFLDPERRFTFETNETGQLPGE